MSVALVNPEIAEKGGRITKAVMEGGAAGWSTLIGKNIAYAPLDSDYGKPSEIVKPEELGEAVVTPVDWSGDTEGKMYLLTPTAGAKVVVAYMMALMLGGDPNPGTTQLDADGMDAYSEAVNSFFGQGAQQARSELGGTIKTAIGASSVIDFAKKSPDEVLDKGDYFGSRVKVTVEGLPPFAVMLLMARSVTGVAPDSDTGDADRAEVAQKLGVDPVNLGIAMKIKLPLIVCIASKKMRMELIQDMSPGTIIEFRKMSGENLDVVASNVKVATAEAVIINQCFGVQIRSIVDPQAAVKE